MAGLRVLLLLPQFPQDPASGAARSMAATMEMLAAEGFACRVLAVTAGEGVGVEDPKGALESHGIALTAHPKNAKRKRPELTYEFRGVGYRLVDTGILKFIQWERRHAKQFDLCLDQELAEFDPDVVLTYGGYRQQHKRLLKLRRHGVRTVLSLHNHGYVTATSEFFELFDGVMTCSDYLGRRYKEACNIDSVGLAPPIAPNDIIADEREQIFFTMVNPAPEKGLVVLAQLAEQLGVRRPDIPLLVIESRGSAGKLVEAGMRAGFDLRRHENLMMSPQVPLPKDIYGPTKAVLIPSLVQEPFGRVAPEAMLNGVVPIGSNRGGLEEICREGGVVVEIPEGWTEHTPLMPLPEVVEPWLEWMEKLEDDADLLEEYSKRALEASKAYLPEALAPRYRDFFLRVAG